MDKLDSNILRELTRNSRIPITKLAKKLRSSREVVNYRISNLKKEGLILGFVTEIDLEKLGFIGAAVFINIKAEKEEEFRQFIKNSPHVSWVAEHSGIWKFILSIFGRNNKELDDKFLQLYNTFKDAILDHKFILHKSSHFFYEKYFGELPSLVVNKKKFEYTLDKKDKIILKELSKNSRITSVDLSNKTSITIPAVLKRIKKLELAGYIKRYSIFVDLSKLNLFQYSIFIVNKKMEEKEKLISYLTQHPNVSFIAEYIGDPFLEFGLILRDPYELRKILQGIEETFVHNKVIEISLFQKEFVSVGPPDCVFE